MDYRMRVNRNNVSFYTYLVTVTFSVISVFLAPAQIASSISVEQRLLLESGILYYDIEGEAPSCSSNSFSTSSGTSLYMIGDSITEGSESELTNAFTAAGLVSEIDGLSSRSLSEGDDAKDGQTVIENSSEAYSNVSVVVVALGTNGGFTSAGIQKAIETIKASNSDATIFWVNLGVNNDVRSTSLDVSGYNQILAENTSQGYTVIDWAEVVENNPEYIDPDPSTGLGVHPIDEGKDAFAKSITDAFVQSSGDTTATGCSNSNLTGSDNQQKVFNFFISNGFTPFQAAGVVGNMVHESGVEPKKYQGYFGGQLFSSAEIQAGTVSPRGDGWGIVQWTPSSKMIVPSFDSGIDYESIDSLEYQLSFLLDQLNNEGVAAIIGEKPAGDHLRATTDVSSAAESFANKYERCADCDPGSPTIAERIATATDVLIRYGSGN